MSTLTKLGTLTLKGKSGRKYEFDVYSIDSDFPRVAAVYAVTKRTRKADGGLTHHVIYFGQTGNLPERFDDHHKADCFARNGANCVCVHRDSNEASRLKKEADLVAAYNPTCNG